MARTAPPEPGVRHFLDGGGEAARMIRERDWRTHPLGAPDTWPDTLRTAISLVLNSPESMILAWGPELFFFFNDTYFPLLGPRLDWAMGERFDRVWADGWDQAQPIIADAMAGRSRRFVDLPWKLDTDRGVADTFWTFSYSRILDPAGDAAGLFILTNETTSRVLTDAALARSQAELIALNTELERRVEARTAEIDRLWETSPDMLLSLAIDGTVQRVNPAWTDILGFTADELNGRFIGDLVHPDDVARTQEAIDLTIERKLPVFENRYRHRDGSYRWVSWVAAPTATEILATGRHVTAQKEAEAALRRAEEQLRQSARIEAIGHLTGGMAHDFNNLLTVIRGSVDLLRRGKADEARRTRHVDAIADAADRAARLTGQLLAFARRQTLTPETFDVGHALVGLNDMLTSLLGPGVAITLDMDAAARFVSADRAQFDTAIVNIAVNARDAMNGAGRLHLAVGTADAIPPVRSHPARDGAFVTITLRDTGTGMTPAMIERIFEPFYSTKGVGHGTGLGLSQVIGFAKQSGGDVLVDSRQGAGAAFTLYLPLVAGDVPAVQVPAPAAPGPAPRGSILVVEDNAEVGLFATQALEDIGYATVLAADGVAALAELDVAPGRFDAVFSDVVMPRMSGIELAQAIRRDHPALPVVLTSGYSSVLAEEGTHGFELLRKPYSIEALAAVLARAIAGTPR